MTRDYDEVEERWQPEKKGHGCVFYGCLTLVVLVVLFIAGGYYLYQTALNRFTDTAPRELPVVEVSEEDWRALDERVKGFTEAIDKKVEGPVTLTLTTEDLNAMIAKDPDLKELAGKVHAAIDGEEIKVNLSLPLDDLGYPGRYFNGSAKLKVSFEDGKLNLKIREAETKGNPIPAPIVKMLEEKNLVGEVSKDPEANKDLNKLESIKVDDGKIVLKRKPQD